MKIFHKLKKLTENHKTTLLCGVLGAHMCALTTIPAHGQSLWLTLRQHETHPVVVVDSLSATGDTLAWHTAMEPDTLSLKPYFDPDEEALPNINTTSFMINYKPVEKEIKFESNYTPEAQRQKFLAATGKASTTPSFADPLGLTPIARAKYEYIKEHPGDVHYAWDEIPDPTKDLREGRKLSTSGNEHSELSRLFQPDESFYFTKKIKEKEKGPVSPWKFKGEENLQFSQLFVNNWIKGGDRSASLHHDFRATLLYSQGRSQWETSLTSKLGLTYTTEPGTRVSDDEFNLSSKYGFKAVNKWYYSFLTTFKTQLFKNYSSRKVDASIKSMFFSPAYTTLIVGMDYKRDNMSLLLSPYTTNITSVADTVCVNPKNYGIEPGKRAYVVNGFSVTYNWKKTIVYGVYYTTKVELFYEYIKKDGNKRMNWENILDVQINRYLSTRLLLEFRYFDNESDKFQLKENFSIAFKYAF